MCTLTIHRSAHSTIITMNRDELRTRTEDGVQHAKTPHNIEYLFPVDALSGGTWLGVNAYGIGGCLLNRYGDLHLRDNSDVISRGKIIPPLLECRDLEGAYRCVGRLPLQRLRNFDLFLFDNKTTLQCIHKNGTGITKRITSSWTMKSSSSWNTDPVVQYRQHKFAEYLSRAVCHQDIADSVLRDFHFADTGDNQFSVLMSRIGSHTKSVSQIVLDRRRIIFRYFDERALGNVEADMRPVALDSLGPTFSMLRHR